MTLLAQALLLAATRLVAPSDPVEIIGGVPTEAGEFESVVAIYDATRFLCTGTLVADGLVLTAAHCVFGNQGLIVAGGSVATRASAVAATDAAAHPDYCPDCGVDVFDYAYIRIPAGSLPVSAFAQPIVDQDDWDTAIGPGGAVTIVGYGEDERGTTQTKRKVLTWITGQSASGQEFNAGGDFRDSCRGDSGGPAFVRMLDGRWRQAGIVSRGGVCGHGGIYATPYPALDWVQSQTSTQLCGADCSDCACVDTSPADGEQGCGCSSPENPAPKWLLLALLGLLRRREAG